MTAARPALSIRIIAVAALAACAIGALPTTSSAAAGTIRFRGAIVAPPYQVQRVGPGATVAAGAAELRFSGALAIGASVRADAGSQRLALRCSSAGGKTASCRLATDGGVVSIAPAADRRLPEGAVLTVTYD